MIAGNHEMIERLSLSTNMLGRLAQAELPAFRFIIMRSTETSVVA